MNRTSSNTSVITVSCAIVELQIKFPTWYGDCGLLLWAVMWWMVDGKKKSMWKRGMS